MSDVNASHTTHAIVLRASQVNTATPPIRHCVRVSSHTLSHSHRIHAHRFPMMSLCTQNTPRANGVICDRTENAVRHTGTGRRIEKGQRIPKWSPTSVAAALSHTHAHTPRPTRRRRHANKTTHSKHPKPQQNKIGKCTKLAHTHTHVQQQRTVATTRGLLSNTHAPNARPLARTRSGADPPPGRHLSATSLRSGSVARAQPLRERAPRSLLAFSLVAVFGAIGCSYARASVVEPLSSRAAVLLRRLRRSVVVVSCESHKSETPKHTHTFSGRPKRAYTRLTHSIV